MIRRPVLRAECVPSALERLDALAVSAVARVDSRKTSAVAQADRKTRAAPSLPTTIEPSPDVAILRLRLSSIVAVAMTAEVSGAQARPRGTRADSVRALLRSRGGGALSWRHQRFINLCGGGYGVNNFVGIPGAVRDGLGDEVRHAFSKIFDAAVPLPARIDQFRAALVGVEEQAKDLPSWRTTWQIVRPSLSFIAALLAGVDLQRFTFYHQGKLASSSILDLPSESRDP
jgi:hypothetical protein